jgi:two-component system, NarL family, sensor kinase
LHDDLGPVLTAVGLNLDVARTRLTDDPDAAARHLSDAKEANAQALVDIRRVVQGLRPPALDDLGLVGALQAQAKRMRGADVDVDVEAGDLPPLPAAVEVAAFRIAVEALTNAVRHGNARHCRIRLTASSDGDLVVDVHDDGHFSGPWVPGVGLTGMRERAAELGGALSAGPTTDGAAVTARLPLPAATS